MKKIKNFFKSFLKFLVKLVKNLLNKKYKAAIGCSNKTKKVTTKNIEGGKFTKTKFNNCGDLTFNVNDHSSNDSTVNDNNNSIIGDNNNNNVINNIYNIYNINNMIGESLNNKDDEENIKYLLFELTEVKSLQIKNGCPTKTTISITPNIIINIFIIIIYQQFIILILLLY